MRSIDPRCGTLREVQWPSIRSPCCLEPCRGNHLGQRSCASAPTGRTYGRKRSDQSTVKRLARRGPSTYGLHHNLPPVGQIGVQKHRGQLRRNRSCLRPRCRALNAQLGPAPGRNYRLVLARAGRQNEGMGVALDREMEVYRRELPGLLADPANRGQLPISIAMRVFTPIPHSLVIKHAYHCGR